MAYEKDECEPDLYNYAQGILAQLHGLDLTVGMEPGRYLVAKSGEFVCSVLYEKQNKTKRFVVVDGAMNDLIRPSLYEAYHEIILPYNQAQESLCDVVGEFVRVETFLLKQGLYLALKVAI